MPRPPDVSNDNFVDAVTLAAAGSVVDRTYTAADLPRLSETGAAGASTVHASLRFSLFDGQPAIDGRVSALVMLTCQRCTRPVETKFDEHFQVLVVAEERADEPGGYEPVIANPVRLDLRWLVEDQILLALPLVPMHAEQQCADDMRSASMSEDEQVSSPDGQKPFQNLRDMMRKR